MSLIIKEPMKATYNKKSATNADPEASRQSASPRSEQKRKFVIEVPDLDDEIPRLMPGKRRRLSAQPTRQSAAPPAVEPASVFASTSANEEVLSTIDSDLLAVPAISNDIEADSAAEGSQSSSPKKGKIKMIDRMNGRPTSRRSQTPDASNNSSPGPSKSNTPTPSRNRISRTASAPDLALSGKSSLTRQNTAPDLQQPFESSISPTKATIRPPILGVSGQARKTYARSRSYLKEVVQPEDDILAPIPASSVKTTSLGAGMIKARQSYAEMRKALGEADGNDQDEDGESEQDSQLGLLSISNLRSHGEMKRFDDEMAYLLDGLRPEESIGLRRTSAVEIVRKLGEANFIRKLRTGNYLDSLYQNFVDAGAASQDRVLGTCLAFYLATIFKNHRDAELVLSSKPECLSTLSDMLQLEYCTRDISTDTKGLGKAEKTLLASVSALIKASAFWTSQVTTTEQVTLRRLVLSTLSSLASQSPSARVQPIVALVTSGAFASVCRSCFSSLKSIEIPQDQDEQDIVWDDKSLDFDQIDECLQIIEACTSASQPLPSDIAVSTQAKQLTNLVVSCHIAACSQDILQASAAFDCTLTTLRVLINLVNLNEEYTTAFMEGTSMLSLLTQLIVASEKPSSSEKQVQLEDMGSTLDAVEDGKVKVSASVLKFDLLCLSLALLTNLLESYKGDGCRKFAQTTYSMLCPGSEKCLPVCRCSEQESSIHVISALFRNHLPAPDLAPSADDTFLRSYTCVLLGLIMIDSPERQAAVLKDMSTEDGSARQLVQALKEFAQMHASVEQGVGIETDATASSLQRMINDLESVLA